MRTISMNEFNYVDLDVRDLKVFPENWTKQGRYERYRNIPRPCSGIIIVSTDIEERYIERGGNVVVAKKGDVIYIPQGVYYHADIRGGTGDLIDSYTLNFRLVDSQGEDVILSDKITRIVCRQDDLFTIRAAALSDAVHRVDGHGTSGGRNYLKIKAALYYLLDGIAASATEQSGIYYPIRAGAEAMRKEWNSNEKVETYAQLCGVSPAYFYRRFRQWCGKSPVEYRNGIRLSNAETMLRYTDMQISEISRTVGFTDPFYFCRLFAKEYGISPKKYRESFRSAEQDR